MTKDTKSSRRSFLKTSALIAAPLAAAIPTAALADDGTKARLRRLEDEAAIREAYQNWLRQVNTGERSTVAFDETIKSVAADHKGGTDRIEFASDGLHATGRYASIAEIESPISSECTIAQMLAAQGHGTVSRTERGVLTVAYVKTTRAWTIEKAEFATMA
jgi:hypothetical protein